MSQILATMKISISYKQDETHQGVVSVKFDNNSWYISRKISLTSHSIETEERNFEIIYIYSEVFFTPSTLKRNKK